MKITSTMNLDELNDRTGGEMEEAQLEVLRDLLNETEYATTEEMPESEFIKLIEAAVI